ncbi:MAG TPA: ABC transporter substrate-binding protein, partial [Rummeliibacillus sp.]|nr:ABC transporter substrate-binding protein [Rummeliibacillus sp.]
MKKWLLFLVVVLMFLLAACGSDKKSNGSSSKDEGGTIKVGVLASLTGPLESYGKQTKQGFELGLDYATDGKREVAGKKIEVVWEDTETKPEVAVQKATKLLEDDGVDFLVGSSSSGDTLAVLPLAEEYEKIMIV